MSLLTNQFKQGNVVGQLDLTTNPNPAVMSVTYNPNGAGGTIIPGEGLRIVDLGASDSIGDPIVDIRGADANAILGVLIFDTKGGTKAYGDRVTVAKKGAVVYMEANAAIARGAVVALVLASPGKVVTRNAEAVFGLALDKASASGDIIRVEVKAEGFV